MVDLAHRATATGTGLGVSLPRVEDDRLLRGEGRFVDDLHPFQALHMAVLRCPFPRAQVVSIDVSAAKELVGVEQIYVGSYVAERSEPISVLRPVPGAPDLPFFALATDVAHFEGQPVVSVVARSRAIAEDALDLIDVEFDPLPHVSDVVTAMEPDAPILHPNQLTTNRLVENRQERGTPDAELDASAVVAGDRFWINRVTALPMEGRAVVAEWRQGARELTVHHSTQTPHLVRKQLAEALRLDESSIRVVTGDVGGGFGMKLGIYPEDVLACLHAIELGRPVKWVEDRTEHFRSSTHARESVHDARIGASADGTFTAMTNAYATDLGALNSPFGSAQLTSITFGGPYNVEHIRTERMVTLTSKTPIGAYRGYGQPESNFVREVLIDRIARQLGRDPLDLRLQNLLRPDDLPWTNHTGAILDSGDYAATLRMAADQVDYNSLRTAGRGHRPDGRLTGIGLSCFIERTGYPSARFLANRGSQFGAHEGVTLRANRSGGIDLITGVSSFGQSSETAFTQLLSEVTGVDAHLVRVHTGDTSASPINTGGFASRTTIAAAGAIELAGLEFIGKALRIAAWLLEIDDPDSLEVRGAIIGSIDGDGPTVSLANVFSTAILGQGIPPSEAPGLEATAYFEPQAAAYAFGSAAAVVAVDPETGDFEIERFVMVHDCGVPVNPMLVEGQVLGALAQGFGAALMEELRYDPDTGQLLNGSLLDYFAPTAADLPRVELLHTEVPSPVTPLGVRGVGEIGTIPPGAAIVNAVCDALADRGVAISRLPITPEAVWRALADADTKGARS